LTALNKWVKSGKKIKSIVLANSPVLWCQTMSGIAGVIYPQAHQAKRLLAPMLDMLVHRGGLQHRETFSFANLEVGTTGQRLTQTPRLIVAIDGQLYNQQELLALFKKRNHSYAGSEESGALIAEAYQVFGSSFLEYLEGDFALFILDREKKQILLARDRIGKKPLYWFHNSQFFIFASGLKAILATGAVPQTAAFDAIANYLYFGFIPQDLSPIQQINKLLPAHYLQSDLEKRKIILPYWSYSSCFTRPIEESQETIISTVTKRLQESVSSQIPKDLSFGCALSGDLGTASIASCLHQLFPERQLPAFTVGFQQETEEQVKAAKEIAEHFHFTEHCDSVTPETLLKDLVKIVWHLEEPLADPTIVATWRLAELSKSVKTIFAGMGSDELLAGHNRYTIEEHQRGYGDWTLQYLLPLFKPLLMPILHCLYPAGGFKLLQQARTNPWQLDYLNQNALFSGGILASAAPRLAHLFDPHLFLHKFHNLDKIPSAVSSFLYLDVKTRLVDNFILQHERLCTAQGVDFRTPYLSKELLEYLARIPEPNELREQEASRILKNLLKKELPAEILNRPKRTHRDFLQSWVEDSNLGKIFQMLPKGRLTENGIISEQWLQREAASTTLCSNSFRYLWALLILEIWFRLFINRRIDTTPPTLSVEELLGET
jgi:asparagine synthase (glutamine-hydrolysing)